MRFRNEVRIARQVSHPNVCRVYDLGMVEGLHFLSMEYIDGEDLASLIRRIGRLPQDKAVEFTRKICIGLAAAHERGVLHRDLKPANIMIDGRGQVRITDFGLAALAAEIPLSDLRSGTPAYMSPEQKAGQEVTTRSDIYSLGLVLHEMFTGKSRKDAQTHPSELVTDLDPAIERLILRCLEEEPKRRPSSALGVAMALPGGDPIAAALAAGETPSPEMIAASQEKEGLSPRAAMLCFVGVVLSLAIGLWIAETTSFLARAPLPIPPDALADRAQQLLKTIGYPEEPRSRDYEFTCCDQQAVEALYRYPPARRAEILASHRPAIRSFQYHQHRAESLPRDFVGLSTLARSEPGMIVEQLDALGRLLRLEVRPWADHRGDIPGGLGRSVFRRRSRPWSIRRHNPGDHTADVVRRAPRLDRDLCGQPDGAGPRGGGVVAEPPGVLRNSAVSRATGARVGIESGHRRGDSEPAARAADRWRCHGLEKSATRPDRPPRRRSHGGDGLHLGGGILGARCGTRRQHAWKGPCSSRWSVCRSSLP